MVSKAERAPRGLRAFHAAVLAAFDQIPAKLRADVAKGFTPLWTQYMKDNRTGWRAAAKGIVAPKPAKVKATRVAKKAGTRAKINKTIRAAKLNGTATRGRGRPRKIITQNEATSGIEASEAAD